MNSFDEYHFSNTVSYHASVVETKSLATSKHSDNSVLLYLGGGQRIKGWDFIKEVFLNLSKEYNIEILCLGTFSATQKKEIECINTRMTNESKLTVLENVSDVKLFYSICDFVLIPIISPHFCRPAIEAGFFTKTYIIPDFSELEFFAKHEENCLKYQSNSFSSFSKSVCRLLDEKKLCSRLARSNKAFANKIFYLGRFDDDMGKIFLSNK
nr:glycosyltransferase [Shewanella gelidii]